jgi:VanZ family protein
MFHWRFITFSFLLLLALPFFFIGGPDWLASPLHRAVWDLGHFGFFALLLLLIQLRWPLPHWRQWLGIAVIVFIAGGIIEIVQAYVGRDGTWSDVWRNLIGASLGLFWGQATTRWIWAGRLIAAIALLPSLCSVAQVAWVQYESTQQFPQLSNFENERELLRWKGNVERSTQYHTEGNYGLKIRLLPARYAGFSFTWFLGDWTGYKSLSFDIFNPDQSSLPLVLRIHDEAHDRADFAYADRFNESLVAASGWNHFTIALDDVKQAPDHREMNFTQLRAVGIFTVDLAKERIIYLDNLRLER